MLTARGWWLLFASVTFLVLGTIGVHTALTLLGLAFSLWFVVQWLLFSFQSRVVVRNLSAKRTLSDGKTTCSTLWVRQSVQVQVEVRLQGWFGLPYVSAADQLPFRAEKVEGESEVDGRVTRRRPIEITYSIKCPAVGQVRFEGIRLRLADFQGFFYWKTMVPCVSVHRVLPRLVNASGQSVGSKRHNLLPPPGIHRLHRAGSGSELLDLRDYLPGDPPKTIAWKVSARRDKLITKEFESEVPIRCTLFLDASASVRLGSQGQTVIGQFVEIAVAVAQANSANRDLTGVCIFDEQRVTRMIRPARGARHLAQLMGDLVDAAALRPLTEHAPVDELVELAYPLAKEFHPELLRAERNHVPFWMPWFWRVPAESERQASLVRRIFRLLFVILAVCGSLSFLIGSYAFMDLLEGSIPTSYVPSPLLVDLVVVAGLASSVVFYRRLYSFLSLLPAFAGRRRARWRKQLAAILSLRYSLGPGGVGLLLEDDRQFGLLLQRFLAEHRVPYAPPLYDTKGRYLFASTGKVDVLARVLLQSISRGHDNELFVLMIDLADVTDHLEALLRSVRVALARHHRVIVVYPWPSEIPLPGSLARVVPSAEGYETEAEEILHRAHVLRFQDVHRRVRREFSRIGVPVIWATGDQPVALILERVERLRGLGRRR